MGVAYTVVLFLLALFSAFQGFITISMAGNALHQQYGAMWLIVFAVSFSGCGILVVLGTIANRLAKIRDAVAPSAPAAE